MTQQAVRDEPVAYDVEFEDGHRDLYYPEDFKQVALEESHGPVVNIDYLHTSAQHVAHDAAVVELIEAAERVRDFGGPPLIRNEDEYNRAYAALGASIEVLRAHKESP